MFRLGLIVNPMAGVGGSVGLKGSDGEETALKALEMGAQPKANLRTQQALEPLRELAIEIITYPGVMGEDSARHLGFEPRVIGQINPDHTTANDTIRAAKEMAALGVDLIMFAGGDGTARNICDAIGDSTPVLGIPAGVKIHSGVYTVTPHAAGEVVAMLVKGELVTLADQEVRDIDEQAFREGRVRAKYYGELLVPEEGRFMQHTKEGGREVEELVLDDIAADFAETMEDDVRYIMGSGSTVQALMDNLGLDNTLLGVDLIENGELIGSDLTAAQLMELTDGHETRLVITIIGGQGHIIGRGNQQLSPELLNRLGKENILVVATKSKIKELEGRPLIVDSGDSQLNHKLSGLIRVTTGYRDAVLYRVADY